MAHNGDRQPWLLMCPADHYGIEYEINPWMSRSRSADKGRANRQWRALYDAIVQLGARVSVLDPVAGLPDMVFTANDGLVFGRTFISARFRPQVRQSEVPYYERWFEREGFAVRRLPDGMFHEGAGDALFAGATLFGGYRIRSDVRSHQHIAGMIGCQTLPVELVDPRFYHLDTCFCPVAADLAIWYPAAFDPYGQRVIRERVSDLIEVLTEEAVRFGCNAVVIDRTVIMPAGCRRLRCDLETRNYCVIELELDEFLKAGGSAKCLTLRVDGEEAAEWRYDPKKLAESERVG
jgi:N-dimethylarginine dimethylaminohydrolase